MVGSTAAWGGIVVEIGSAADTNALFWVETKSNHARIHGSHTSSIDQRFIRPGEAAHIPVLTLNPITFSFVYASVYHPAYLYETKRANELPSAFNTVALPKFEPRSWRDFIDSGEKVLHAGQGIHLGNVIDHFKLFLKAYLPAIDDAGRGADLTRYIPLFEEIIRHTEKTLPQTTYSMKAIEDQRKADPAYAKRLDDTEKRRLKELEDLFAEIKALLSISTEERVRLRSLQAKLVHAGSVYHDLMSADDRQTIEEFLDFQFENRGRHPRPESTRRWLGSGTNILYSITLGPRYALNDKNSTRLYDTCYRTALRVDLYGGVKTDLKNTHKNLSANFCRDAKDEWVIQLPRR